MSDRGAQLKALNKLQIAKVEGIRSATVKTVLRCIDDFGRSGCWAGLPKMSEFTGYNERTVRRALLALIDLNLITVVSKEIGRPTHYKINWEAVSGDPNPGQYAQGIQIDTLDSESRDPGQYAQPTLDSTPRDPGQYAQQYEKNRNVNRKKNRESVKARTPSGLEEVDQFWKEKKLEGEASAFFYHYEANGWHMSGKPMKDWKAAAQKWSLSEKSRSKQGRPQNYPIKINL